MHDQSDDTQPLLSEKFLGLVGTVVILLVSIVAGAIGKVAGREGAKSMLQRPGIGQPVRGNSPAAWSSRSFGDISLDAPFQFRPAPGVRAKLPSQVRDAIDSYTAFESGDSTNPRVAVSRVLYRSGVQVDLDGAMNGAMNGAIRPIATAAGDSDPRFTFYVTTVDGLPARRASYVGVVQGTSVHIDALFAQSGNTVWQVHLVATGESSVPDSKRVLDSVRIDANR